MLGQPDDKGLYFPDRIPAIDEHLLGRLHDMPNEEIAFEVIKPFIEAEIPEGELHAICRESVNFDFPLVRVSSQISALELFHGPTLAFKDVGARFMSRCLQYFSRDSGQRTVVVVATSGDTGGAVANGFHGLEGVSVVILYPKGKVSRVQELQLTTLGGNVITLEVRGSFDDCQALAKRALADAELRKNVFLTSANSINVARWLPQQFYYFFALKHWEGDPPVISVPSGNFGNLAAGMLAYRSGLPIIKFIAACNANDVVPEFFRTGIYRPKPAVSTISNAMDVGDPSNFVRILELFKGDNAALRDVLDAISISDERTKATMIKVFRENGYVLDPHGAVAFTALKEHLVQNSANSGIFMETAHPVKFDSVEQIIGNHIVMPEAIVELEKRAKIAIEIEADYDAVRSIVSEIV